MSVLQYHKLKAELPESVCHVLHTFGMYCSIGNENNLRQLFQHPLFASYMCNKCALSIVTIHLLIKNSRAIYGAIFI